MKPLAYNSVPVEALATILNQYRGQPHSQIILDFENQLKHYLKTPTAVALNSGTSALHLALKSLEIGEGDWVIAPTFTYVATINPICYLGAQPIFVDSEAKTGNIDPTFLEEAILDSRKKNRKVKAIIVVHTYGTPAQLDRIRELSHQYEVPLIEDAAESLGSSFRGKMTGTIGRLGVLSFNNNKVISTFGGGAVITEDINLSHKIRWWSQQARDPLPYYEHREIGYNYGMGPINAAAGLAMLPEIDQKIALRENQFQTYKRFCPSHWIFQEASKSEIRSNRWLIPVIMGSIKDREEFQSKLTRLGFETRRVWRPMHCQPVFNRYPFYGTKISEGLFDLGLCLPCGELISEFDISTMFD